MTPSPLPPPNHNIQARTSNVRHLLTEAHTLALQLQTQTGLTEDEMELLLTHLRHAQDELSTDFLKWKIGRIEVRDGDTN